MTEPLVSVVVPTYNRSATLRRAVRSALGQTHPALEVIVVDDASTDDTADVVAGFDDERVRYLRHDENRGGAAARNTGIEAARGTYVAFLDSDDEWKPTKVRSQVRRLSAASEEWIAVYTGYRIGAAGSSGVRSRLFDRLVRGQRGTRPDRREGGADLLSLVHACAFDLGGASTLMVRRTAVEAVDGFDESFPRHQDWEFLARLLRIGKLAYVPDELVVKHETGPVAPETLVAAKRRYFEKFADDFADLEDVDPVCAHYRQLADCYFNNGRPGEGVRFALASRRRSPRSYVRFAVLALAGWMNAVRD